MQNYEDKIDLTQYFERFYRTMKRMKFLLVFIVIAAVAVIELKTVLFFQTVYSSQAVMVVYLENQDNIFEFSDSSDEMFTTFQNLICGNMMREVIMEDLELKSLDASVSLYQVTDTNLAELKVTSADPQLSYDAASCILNNYKQVTDIVISDVAVSVIDTPSLAQEPDAYPDYFHEGIKALAVALGIDFMIVLLFAVMRRTVIDSSDVKNILHLRNITKIPYIGVSQRKKQKNYSLLLSNPRIQYSFRQSFHDIRMRLEQEKNRNDLHTFLIASVFPNEGKSTVAVNTAIALAQKDYKVILVDLDLRNPSIYKILKDEKISGNIADYLKGEYCLEEVINKYQDYSLDVIYGVRSCNDATEILMREEFHDFMELLKEKYDFVILDAPPLYMLEDAMIISRCCDSSLIVIKQDYVNANEVLDALEDLNQYLSHISGTVINQAKPSLFHKDEEHYGYGYK